MNEFNTTSSTADTGTATATSGSAVTTTILPGFSKLVREEHSSLRGIFLLSGGAGVGKTMYCRQFLLDGLQNHEHCIFVSSSLDRKQFAKLFLESDHAPKGRLLFVNPYSHATEEITSEKTSADLLTASLRQIQDSFQKICDSHADADADADALQRKTLC